jgi:hypothetical protein
MTSHVPEQWHLRERWRTAERCIADFIATKIEVSQDQAPVRLCRWR